MGRTLAIKIGRIKGTHAAFQSESLKERVYLEELVVDDKILK
jgi:hypothetical protein